jgi:hypothetical protein
MKSDPSTASIPQSKIRWPAVCLLVGLAMAGCTGPAHAKDAPPGNKDDPGRKVYVMKCAKCHKYYDPAKYSDEEWQGWMAKMTRKAKLSPEQTKQLDHYIEQTLRPH